MSLQGGFFGPKNASMPCAQSALTAGAWKITLVEARVIVGDGQIDLPCMFTTIIAERRRVAEVARHHVVG